MGRSKKPSELKWKSNAAVVVVVVVLLCFALLRFPKIYSKMMETEKDKLRRE